MTQTDQQNVPKLRFPGFGEVWDSTTLGKVSARPSYGMNAAARDFDGKHKYIRITDISDAARTFLPSPLTSPEPPISKEYQLKQGDIVFARTGASTGKSYLYNKNDGELYFAGFLIRFSITDGDPNFVFAQTLRKNFTRWITVVSMRSGQPGINAQEYAGYTFKSPTLPEQRKIAGFLSAVDTKIAQLAEKKRLLEDYKKGCMQQLFSQKIRFKDEDGEDFPEWEEKKLGEVANIVGGGTPDSGQDEYWGGEIPWFTPTEMKSKYVTDSVRTISSSGLKKSSAKLLPIGTILVTTRATVGDLSIAMKECCTNQGFQSLIVKDENCNEFWYYWMVANKKELLRRASGSTFLEINKSEIAKIPTQRPHPAEQRKIADFLSALDRKIAFVAEEHRQAQTFKKGLLQQMFV
jgi:type I restriction enzyme S subunit